MQEFQEANGVPFQEHGEQVGAQHKWTIAEMKDELDRLMRDISRLKEEAARATAEADCQEGSLMRAIIIWEIFKWHTQGGIQGPSDIINKLVFEFGILEEVHKLLSRKKNLFYGKNIENLHDDARSKLVDLVKQALCCIQGQKLKVQSLYHPYLRYNNDPTLPFLPGIEESSHNGQQQLWHNQGFVPNDDQQQAAGQPRLENYHVPNMCSDVYMPDGPLPEGTMFDSIISSKAQSSMHYCMFPSEESSHYYSNCNFEGGDAINLEVSNWADTVPVTDTMTSYMPMNLNESAAIGTFSQYASPIVADILVEQYPIKSVPPTVMNQTQNEEVNVPIKAHKSKKGKAVKEEVDTKNHKHKARRKTEGRYKMDPQLPYESGQLSGAAARPFGDYYGSPQIEKFQEQAGGVYSQKPLFPLYYATQNMPLCSQTQPPAMVQMPPYGFPTGMTCNPGFQDVLNSYPDDGGSRIPVSSKVNEKKKHKEKSIKKAILSPAELNSQDIPEKQTQQSSGVGGGLSDVDFDEQKSKKVKIKAEKKKGKGMGTNIQGAERKSKRKKNSIKIGNLQEIGENSSTAQSKRSTFFVRIFLASKWSLQACHCVQVDKWVRKVAPALWLQIVKGGACKMTHCCTFAWKMICGVEAIKKVFSLLLRFASSIVRPFRQLLRRIFFCLWHLAVSLSQFGVRICRCMWACSDKLIPNLTACISAPIKAILQCGIATVRAPCRLLCSKRTGISFLHLEKKESMVKKSLS